MKTLSVINAKKKGGKGGKKSVRLRQKRKDGEGREEECMNKEKVWPKLTGGTLRFTWSSNMMYREYFLPANVFLCKGKIFFAGIKTHFREIIFLFWKRTFLRLLCINASWFDYANFGRVFIWLQSCQPFLNFALGCITSFFFRNANLNFLFLKINPVISIIDYSINAVFRSELRDRRFHLQHDGGQKMSKRRPMRGRIRR